MTPRYLTYWQPTKLRVSIPEEAPDIEDAELMYEWLKDNTPYVFDQERQEDFEDPEEFQIVYH